MSFVDVLSHRYQLNTIVNGFVSATHDGLHLLTRPRVGARLVLYGVHNAKRIVTSRVTRLFTQVGVDGTFVETTNSVYLLQLERIAAPTQSLRYSPCAELQA